MEVDLLSLLDLLFFPKSVTTVGLVVKKKNNKLSYIQQLSSRLFDIDARITGPGN
jgi:hypothetical protein